MPKKKHVKRKPLDISNTVATSRIAQLWSAKGVDSDVPSSAKISNIPEVSGLNTATQTGTKRDSQFTLINGKEKISFKEKYIVKAEEEKVYIQPWDRRRLEAKRFYIEKFGSENNREKFFSELSDPFRFKFKPNISKSSSFSSNISSISNTQSLPKQLSNIANTHDKILDKEIKSKSNQVTPIIRQPKLTLRKTNYPLIAGWCVSGSSNDVKTFVRTREGGKQNLNK